MKLLVALVVVSLAGVARSDEEFYSASAPQSEYYQPQYTSSYSNYHQQAPHYGNSFLDSIFGGNRRQFADFGAIAILPAIGLLLLGGVLAATAVYFAASSGRGLDTDEWEVDHSVWMNQLQRDFEDSWSTE